MWFVIAKTRKQAAQGIKLKLIYYVSSTKYICIVPQTNGSSLNGL